MRRPAAWLGALLSFWLSTATAVAEPAPPPPLVLIFHESGADLPKEEIRAALERQLGRQVQSEVNPDLGEITVGRSTDGQLIVRYRPPRAELERRLPAPEAPEELAEIVSLAAQNLILNQAKEVVHEIEKRPAEPAKLPAAAPSPPPKPAAATPPSPAPRAKRLRRGRTSLQVGVDYVFLPGSETTCTPGVYRCYDGETPVGSNVPGDAVSPRIAQGTGRFQLNQEYYWNDNYWLGLQWGLAFADEPTRDFTFRSDTRVGHTFGAPRAILQPKVFIGFGIGDVAASVETRLHRGAAVDAWGRFGTYFATVGAGLTYLPHVPVLDGLGIELELPLFLLFPELGVAATPTIGLVVAY
jgi:hypothetical protein